MGAGSRLRGMAAVVLLVAARSSLAATAPSLDGSWTGGVDGPGGNHGTLSATLAQSGSIAHGSLVVGMPGMAATFVVTATLAGRRLSLVGRVDRRRLRGRARWDARTATWRGGITVRDRRRRLHALVALARDTGGPAPRCGADYFASDVMPKVVAPICAQCHVPGGLAQTAAFRVTPGDPVATSASALRMVDVANPSGSRLLQKPLGGLGHGGGQRFLPGSPEALVLQHWIELVTAPACGTPGGGNGGPATGASLFAADCASCHGADASGTPGKPDIRCATRAADAIRVGRGAGMPPVTALTDADVALVEGYLDGLCTQAGRPAAALFAGNCSTCHGGTAGGGQNGLGVQGPDIHCNRSIATPVRAGQGTGMPAFAALIDADVASIQAYLTDSFCPAGAATGADLYASNCATCHGADARGVNGNPNIRCNRAIHDPVVRGQTGPLGTMPAFTLADAEIALVQAYLGDLCPAGAASGSDLYAGNCATCHGADAGGTSTAPDVRCATRVADAVTIGRATAMPAFPALAGADLTSVETFLADLCAQAGRTGADLYAGNCSTCHGATARGGRNAFGVRGPDIRCTGANDYLEAVRQGEDAMPRFPALDTNDVSAIAAFVLGAYCPGG